MTLLKRLQEEARKEYVWHSPEIGDYIQNLDHPDDINDLTANTVTAVLDEIEREVEAGDLTRKFMESLEHPTPEEYYAYNQGIADIKTIIQSKRTEV